MQFKLKRPVEHDGTTYDALTLREATLDDLIAMEDAPGGQLAKFAVMLARLAGVPVPAARKLTATDLTRIQKEAGHLLGNEEEAGESSL